MEPTETRSEPRVDFVTVLSVDDCVRSLKRAAAGNAEQRLSVRLNDGRIFIESLIGHTRRGQPSQLWLLRFEGSLTPVSVGTRVHGEVVRNNKLEGSLAAVGIVTAVLSVLGIALSVPFIGALSVILLILFAAYYVRYQKLLNQQATDLRQWVYEWLTIPQGWAGGSL
jgi:hypothetical protein